MRFSSAWRRLRLFSLVLLTTICCCCWQWLPTSAAMANTPARLVQQGVSAYRDYDYSTAIDRWQAAIALYPEDENSLDRAIVLENLARAYQQTGEPTEALGYWQSATAVHVALQNWPKLGRSLTQQAQAYSQLGQPYQAIGLLCAPVPDAGEADLADEFAAGCSADSALRITQNTEDTIAQIAALGSLGEAYRAIKSYPAALQALQTGLSIASEPESLQHQALLHNSLGNLYKEQSELRYQQAASARRSATGLESTFYAVAKENDKTALEHFRNSEAIARQQGLPTLEVKALLGQISVYAHGSAPGLSQLDSIVEARTQATALWAQLPPTQEKVYLALQLTKRQRPLLDIASTSVASRTQCRDIVTDAATQSLLQQAFTIASSLHNNRLKAFAQGEIGHYHECNGDYTKALDWSQQARLSASGDRVLALDTLYLWQWQTGRIYQTLGQSDAAVDFYSQAVDNLNQIRLEILASNQTLQFDFRDAVAPVYRELANIRLSLVPESLSVASISLTKDQTSSQSAVQASAQTASQSSAQTSAPIFAQIAEQSRLQKITAALGNIDDLQLAELQNYFGSDCIVPVSQRRLDEVLAAAMPIDANAADANAADASTTDAAEASTALVSTVIFPERTAVVLTLPGQMPLLHWIDTRESDLRQSIIDFRNSLEDTANELEGYDTQQAQRLYQQIIAPFQPALTARNIKTLVFVNDGILRNIPMGALYDGSRYLIEQYALAIAPSLQRPDTAAQNALPARALVLGLSKNPIVDGRGLGALPAVKREVKEVVSILPNSQLLLDEAFTKENLKERLSSQPYPVLHIATHGKFETEPDNTFLVTGDKELATTENKLLRLGELDALIRSGAPQNGLLDLIVLSACQTGSGDERSALGLAGVAIRAGADTAMASLWSVDDESTADLITYFYQNWDGGMPKAEALRQAQITVMKDRRYLRHPAYWSAFMLVGDWQ